MKTVAAGVFKTNCPAIMDEVQAKRETVVITKHGRPVAKLVPVDTRVDEIFGFFKGRVPSLATWDPRAFPRKAEATFGDSGDTSGEKREGYSVHSNERVTAFFHIRYIPARFAPSSSGFQVLSAVHVARRSSVFL